MRGPKNGENVKYDFGALLSALRPGSIFSVSWKIETKMSIKIIFVGIKHRKRV